MHQLVGTSILFRKKKQVFFSLVKVGGMRVAAPRPRHTSQGEDKDKATKTEANADDQETSKDQKVEGENAGESTAQEGETSG